MALNDEQIRLIFGLKLRQIREAKDLSLFGLSKKTGLSKSYLNEIEHGKKYPKPDKVVAIAEALDTAYDDMVSMKLSGRMAPLSDIIMSGVLKEIPLDLFGIEEGDLLDIISNAPDKVTAFMGTLVDMARRRNITRDGFFLSALRTHQEMHHNYFPDLEKAAQALARRYSLDTSRKLQSAELEELLQDEFGYHIAEGPIPGLDRYAQIRSVYVPAHRRLHIAPEVSESQRQFILAKELAYSYLKIEQRPHTFTWIRFEGFDEVLNNFKASYFAGALLLNEERMVAGLKQFFALQRWSEKAFFDLMMEFTDSAETFFQRLTNLLPQHFQMRDMFFLRFSGHKERGRIVLNKEYHLGRKPQPQGVDQREHYCRRWVSADVMIHPDRYADVGGIKLGVQKSRYQESGVENLVLAASTSDPFEAGASRSICLGIELNARQKKSIAFHTDPSIATRDVALSCERCGIADCQERVAPARIFDRQKEEYEMGKGLDKLLKAENAG